MWFVSENRRTSMPTEGRVTLEFGVGRPRLYALGVHLALDNGECTPVRMMVDTGLDIAVCGPLGEIQSLGDGQGRRASLSGIAGNQVTARVWEGVITLGGVRQTCEVWGIKSAEEWTIGLPIIRAFHMLIAEDVTVPHGFHLRPPPLHPP